jgi:hypothetical protein
VAEAQVVDQVEEVAPPSQVDEAPEAADPCAPFLTADGRQLRVSATLDPVFEAKGFNRIGFRLIRRVISQRYNGEDELSAQQVAQLSTAELLRIDLATIARGIGRLEADAAQQPSLIVPVSYTSLSSQKGRSDLIAQLKAAGSLVKLGVICEILGVDGVPPAVLLSTISLVRPFALLVVGRLADTNPKAILRLEGIGLQALSFECPPDLGDAEFQAWAAAAVTSARRVARSVLVYGAGTPARGGILAALGASHVGVS